MPTAHARVAQALDQRDEGLEFFNSSLDLLCHLADACRHKRTSEPHPRRLQVQTRVSITSLTLAGPETHVSITSPTPAGTSTSAPANISCSTKYSWSNTVESTRNTIQRHNVLHTISRLKSSYDQITISCLKQTHVGNHTSVIRLKTIICWSHPTTANTSMSRAGYHTARYTNGSTRKSHSRR